MPITRKKSKNSCEELADFFLKTSYVWVCWLELSVANSRWCWSTVYHDWLELGGCWGREEAELSGLWCWGWAVMDRHQPVLSVWTQHNSQSLSLSLAGQVAGDAQLGAGRVLAGIIIQYQSESLLSFQKVAALWLRLSRSWAELGYIVTTTRVTIFPRSVSNC